MISLYNQHGNHLEEFEKDKKKINMINSQINEFKSQYNKLNDSVDNNDIIYNINNNYQLFNIENRINELENQRYNLEDEKNKLEYYSSIDEILIDYYGNEQYKNKIKEKQNIIFNTITTNKRQKIKNINNIMNYFDNSSSSEEDLKNIKINSEEDLKATNTQQYDFIINNEDKYNEFNFCPNCKNVKKEVIIDGHLTCKKCGYIDNNCVSYSSPNHKEMKKIIYPYKRLNHLKECLNQLQAKENLNIPDQTLNQIKLELKKNKITDLSKLTYKDVKDALKRIKLNQYYEHCVFIMVKLSGKQPPVLKRREESEIINMFKNILISYQKMCPKERINFLNYSYVLHKIFQILNNKVFIEFCPLLKSKDKLIQQDIIWKKICKDLNWVYNPSI